MDKEILVQKAKLRLYILAFLFIIAEIIFAISTLHFGNEDIFGLIAKSFFFLIFIFLVIQRYNWAKWVLSIGLIFYAILCYIAGFEQDSIWLKLLSVFYLYFGLILHFTKPFKTYFMTNSKPIVEKKVELDEVKESVQEYEYPLLVKRYQAVLIDILLILLVISITAILFDQIENFPLFFKILFTTLVLSYEAVFTSYRATLGQYLLKIRVRKSSDPEKRINLMQAYARFLIKGFLGWLSFLTINFNSEHKAIHDFVAATVVIKKKGNKDAK